MPFEKGNTVMLGRKLSDETRQKMSASHQNLKPSDWGAGFKPGNIPWNQGGLEKRPRNLIDKVYFAGLFDGEGSLSISTNGRKDPNDPHRYMRISARISMVNSLAVLESGKKIWGGWIYERKVNNSRFTKPNEWVMQHGTAERFLKDIQPFLRLKNKQAEIALKYRWLQTRKKNEWNKISDEEMKFRKTLETELKSLHLKKGVQVAS